MASDEANDLVRSQYTPYQKTIETTMKLQPKKHLEITESDFGS